MKTRQLINFLEDRVLYHRLLADRTTAEKLSDQWPLIAKHHTAKMEAFELVLSKILAGQFGMPHKGY